MLCVCVHVCVFPCPRNNLSLDGLESVFFPLSLCFVCIYVVCVCVCACVCVRVRVNVNVCVRVNVCVFLCPLVTMTLAVIRLRVTWMPHFFFENEKRHTSVFFLYTLQ